MSARDDRHALNAFTACVHVQVIAATNRADILDPALMRSGRLDRKVINETVVHPNISSWPMMMGCTSLCVTELFAILSALICPGNWRLDLFLRQGRVPAHPNLTPTPILQVEFPHPNEDARAKILRIHSRKMNTSGEVNFEELSRSTDDFNAAQLKAVCVEAGMLALRRDGLEVNHEDFVEGIVQVQAKKKANLLYYA